METGITQSAECLTHEEAATVPTRQGAESAASLERAEQQLANQTADRRCKKPTLLTPCDEEILEEIVDPVRDRDVGRETVDSQRVPHELVETCSCLSLRQP